MRRVSEVELEVITRLRGIIFGRSKRNNLRSRFAEGEERLRQVGFAIPPGMEDLQVALNWPAKVVSAFSSRQVPAGFISPTATSLLDDVERVYADNNFASLERWAIHSANQHGCSFVFVTEGDESVGEPDAVITARTALTATATIDPRSRRVVEALELIGQDRVVLYLPGVQLTCVQNTTVGSWQVEEEIQTGTRFVRCAPYVSGGSLEKPFGASRITPTVMDLTYAGARTLLRQDVTAEFYQAPRLALMGADQSVFTDPTTGRKLSPLEVLTGAVWAIPDVDPVEADELGVEPAQRRVQMQQVTQASMQPFSDQFRLIAANLAAASSIPLQYLGVVSDSNPSSADAIRALENDLVYEVRGQFPSLNVGRNLLARAVLSVVHGDLGEAARNDLRQVRPDWEDPTTRSVAEQSQMVALQTQAGNLQPGGRVALSLLPMSQALREAAIEENSRAQGESLMAELAGLFDESGVDAPEGVVSVADDSE